MLVQFFCFCFSVVFVFSVLAFIENLLDEQVRSSLVHFRDEVKLAQVGSLYYSESQREIMIILYDFLLNPITYRFSASNTPRLLHISQSETQRSYD